MGIALWLGAGLAAHVIARLVPRRRGRGWLAELIGALAGAVVSGLIATALDFGGWREPDWRAALFAGLGALALAGAIRAFRKKPFPASVGSRQSGGSP